MLSFVLCDSNINHGRLMTKRLINTVYDQQVLGHVALVTAEPEDVLAYSRQPLPVEHRNVYLLETDTGAEKNGIPLAREIRKYDKFAYIVFVTNCPECVIKNLKLKIFDCLLKPVSAQAVESLVANIYQDYVQTQPTSKQVVVNSGGNIYFLHPVDLIYIESYRNKIVAHCHDKTLEAYGSLAFYEEQLSGEGFYRCHRSFLINLRYVSRLDPAKSLVVMSNGQVCHVSRRNQKGLIAHVGNGF